MMKNEDINLRPLQRFWRLLQVDKKEISHVYLFALFNGLMNLSLPLGIQAIIGLIQGGKVSASWVILVIFVIVGIAISGFMQMMQLKITENLQQKIFTRASFEFAFRIPRIKQEALYKYYPPELVNRFFDTISVQKGLSKILMDFSLASLQVLFGLLLLSFYHPLFIVFGLILLLLIYLILGFTAKRGLKASIEESKHKYEVAHWLEELARTMDTFKLAGKTDLPLTKVNHNVDSYLDSRKKHFRILYTQYGFLVIFKVIVAAGLLVAGGLLVFKQQMNIGQFVAAEIVILMVIASVEKLILSLDTIYDVLTSLEKLGQVTDLPLEEQGGEDVVDVCRNEALKIELDNITYSYPEQENPAILSFSLNINQGDKILITGESGSGKSTLLQLITGVFTHQKGNISYNNIPINNIKKESIRNILGSYMSHDLLFNGTLSENISMGRGSISRENILWAAEKVGLSAFIKNLPQGYNTLIFPEGKRLPRSVSQKILLARSIASKPRLLILEDMMDALSAKEKKQLISFLTSKEMPWALIVASQDKQWVENCDKSIILNRGEVVIEGNSELVKNSDWFKET
ncbi:MAG: ATP-binding cassette domain-containing protein [Bacteroidetes bacterium]|nr:MAG: ATP-binding cassette domain-containing protein [Bacteroidota bacterium]